MEQQQQRPAMMSVPEFGGWDQKAAGATDYSVVFTKARANKKQQKTSLTEIKQHKSLGNEGDLTNAKHDKPRHHHRRRHHFHSHPPEEPAAMGKRKILTYVNCCIRP